MAFLAEVGDVLSGSLEYPDTLTGVACLCVPRLGDGCIVDELREDGTLGAVVTLHRDEGIGAVLAEARHRYPPGENPRSRVADVCRTRRPQRVRDAGAAFVRSLAMDPAHAAILEAMELRSILFVPMLAGARVEGVITLLRTGAGARPYTAADLVLAQEVAARAALHVQNARLYRAARAEATVRKRVVAMVTHEVRSPLSSILLNAGAVLDGTFPAEGEAGKKPLRSIVVAAEQIARLVQDLSDVTRLEAGDLPVAREPFSAAALLGEARLMLEPLLNAAGLASRWEVAGDPGAALGDRERTLQVLSNMVANARRHTARGGTVSVEVEGRGEEVCFTVGDTGSGIDAARLTALLRPLWGEGPLPPGIGLPLSRAIVEAQGGRLWAESRPGSGSRFSFTLPRAELPAALPFAGVRVPASP